MLDMFADMLTPATLRNYSAETVVAGERVRGSAVDTAITLVIPQAVKANELNIDPSRGEYVSDFRVTWVDRAVAVRIRNGNLETSALIIGSDTYKVFSLDDRLESDFSRILLQRIGGK